MTYLETSNDGIQTQGAKNHVSTTEIETIWTFLNEHKTPFFLRVLGLRFGVNCQNKEAALKEKKAKKERIRKQLCSKYLMGTYYAGMF